MEKATAEEFKVQWVNLCACIDLDSCVNMINVFFWWGATKAELLYCFTRKASLKMYYGGHTNIPHFQ